MKSLFLIQKKTGVYNFTDKSMTYIAKQFSFIPNVYLPIIGEGK